MHTHVGVRERHMRITSSARAPRGASITGLVALVSGMALALSAQPAPAQDDPGEAVEMTLEHMVGLALNSSYRVQQLNLGIDRTQLNLRAQRARLRSRVDLDLSAPDYRSISESRWNSTLQREEIVHEDSRRLEAELSVRQPVVLFGYPTNGYLSLNNRVYRYTQVQEDGARDVRYYNRAFVRYTQPLFQPNELKNDLEKAELNLTDAELGFYDDVVSIVDDVADDYFQLFREAYREEIHRSLVDRLAAAEQAASLAVATDSSRSIELGQIRVELANAQEQLLQTLSRFRLEASSIRTRLGMAEGDSIWLAPTIEVEPLPIDEDSAVRFALELTPRMQQLGIDYRENEIRLEETKGRGGIRVDLALSYGREMQDPVFRDMWGDPTNTYTIGVNGRIPIWDWGERKYRIEASRIGVTQSQLRIEQVEAEIRANVRNEVRSVEEFQNRALSMETNLELAARLSEESLVGYRRGEITAADLLQSFRREADTAQNLLDAYLGWRRSITRLQRLTFYDFERDAPVLERYSIAVPRSN